MSFSYAPTDEAVPGFPWNITFLSQRDLALQIPINYVTAPGVSLTTACFSNNRFEEYSFSLCLSNLLASGFRRFVADIYWDAGRDVWSFCPARVPLRTSTKPSQTKSVLSSSHSSQSKSSRSGSSSTAKPTSTAPPAMMIHERVPLSISQNIGSSTDLDSTPQSPTQVVTLTVLPATSTSQSLQIQPTSIPGDVQEVVYSIGKYLCTSGITLNVLVTVVQDYMSTTDNTIEATIKYFTFNAYIAVADSTLAGTAKSSNSSILKSPPTLLSSIFNGSSVSELLTPAALQYERTNLNATWFKKADNGSAPDPQYYTSYINNSVAVSPNAWPSESYMEGIDNQRLVISYGIVDPDLVEPLKADNGTVFSSGSLGDNIQVAYSGSNTLSSGCVFDGSSISLTANNNSWAISNIQSGLTSPPPTTNTSIGQIDALVSCGISPLLNESLGDTADNSIAEYQQVAFSSVWSWVWGEPTTSNNTDFRCAAFDPASNGRWRVMNCQMHLSGACRANGEPFVWSLTTQAGYYSFINSACPDGYTFDVPRTALENRHLLEAVRRVNSNNSVWLNFNSLDTQYCWVVGVDSVCPYSDRPLSGEVAIPTIAAVIILILAGLMVLVKCGSNRLQSKRKRRNYDGWDYEGVPS